MNKSILLTFFVGYFPHQYHSAVSCPNDEIGWILPCTYLLQFAETAVLVSFISQVLYPCPIALCVSVYKKYQCWSVTSLVYKMSLLPELVHYVMSNLKYIASFIDR